MLIFPDPHTSKSPLVKARKTPYNTANGLVPDRHTPPELSRIERPEHLKVYGDDLCGMILAKN
jgi:hypothetical protein